MHKIPKKVECYAAVVKEIIIENCIFLENIIGLFYGFLWLILLRCF